jgi:MFS family permease
VTAVEPNASGASRRLDFAVLAQFFATGITVAGVPAFLLDDLRATRAVTGAATTVFFVAALIARPFIGRFIDRSGRRPLLVWPPLLNAVLVLALTFANSAIQVGVLRFAAGAVGAGFYTAALALTGDLAPPDRQTRAVARLSVYVYIGFVVGPLITEALIRISFAAVWIAIACLHLVAAVAAFGLPDRRPAPGQSASGKQRLFHPAAIGPGIALLTVAFAHSTITAFTGDYGKQLDMTYPRLLLAAFAIAVLVIRVLSGPFADRNGPFAVAVPGIAFGTLGLFVAANAPNYVVGMIAMVMVGIGSGSSFPAITTIVTNRSGPAERGTAVASLLMFNDVGQAVAAPSAGWVADKWGWRWVFGVPAVVGVIGTLSILALWNRTKSEQQPSVEHTFRPRRVFMDRAVSKTDEN